MIAVYLPAMSQIRFSKVDPANSVITIKNFGSDSVDISAYRLCALFQYTNSGLSPLTIVSGSLDLAPDSSVELSGFSLLPSASDLGLFTANGGFGDTAAMVDFLQWGSGGNGRESVANSKGIWNTGDFLSTDGPYFFNGGKNDKGLSFWSNTSTSIFKNLADEENLLVSPNPFTTSTSLSFELSNSYGQDQLSLTIIDLFGRTVRSRMTLPADGKMLLNRGNLTAGVYFLKIQNGQKTIALKKLVVSD